ncbi:MAG: mRNA surveillance protein pelota, partial [Candidatus Aenigmarchaeota archaeon]|nr:mRNA surveillance protein pelota [Candidatus Aenigmarchaeota archaeon]
DIGKVTPENADDLWTLSEIITADSIVTTKTMRSIEIRRGGEKEKVGRKPMVLSVLIEKIDIGETLRLGGKIVAGPEDVEHDWHTIDVKPGTFLKIERKWKSWEINKIKAAEKKADPILICILDDSETDFYMIKENKKHLVHILGGTLGKKTGVSKKPEYYGKVIGELKRYAPEAKKIIIAGPGFAREEIQGLIKQKEKELMTKIIFDSLAHTGEVGLQELFKRGILEKVTNLSRISEETAVVEKLLSEIVKEGKAVYGGWETREALDAGAVEILLVSDKMVREMEPLLEDAEKMRTRVMIISSLHASGEKFLGLGGVGGLLRYKLTS